MSHRFQTADLLKGIAVLLMIEVHIVELFAAEPVYYSSAGKLLLFLGGPPVAPVFMILFGYFTALSGKSAGQLILKGLKIFILGMLLNLALNFNLILSVSNGNMEANIWPYVFGVDILQFAGISLIVIAPVKILKNKFILPVTLCIFSALAGQYLADCTPVNPTAQYVSAFFYGSTPWSYFPLLPWLAYPLAGMIFYNLQKHYEITTLRLRTKILVSLTLAVILACTINHAVVTASDLPAYYHHGILFFLWVVLFVCFYALCLNELTNLAGNTLVARYIKWLGKNVTLIYVIQWILIGNTATEIYKTISSPLHLMGCFVGVLLVSTGIAYGVLKLYEQFFRKRV